MAALRRFETSLKRLKCATSGRSQTGQRTGQVDPKLLFVAKTERRKSNVERTYRIAAVDAHMGPIPDVRGGRGIVWIPPN